MDAQANEEQGYQSLPFLDDFFHSPTRMDLNTFTYGDCHSSVVAMGLFKNDARRRCLFKLTIDRFKKLI